MRDWPGKYVTFFFWKTMPLHTLQKSAPTSGPLSTIKHYIKAAATRPRHYPCVQNEISLYNDWQAVPSHGQWRRHLKSYASLWFHYSLWKYVAALDYTSIYLIEKCFHKAGFICSVLTAPDAEPEPSRNIWDNMQQVLNVQVPIADYNTANDAIEITVRLKLRTG